jgi:hypothetical protein
MAKAPTKEYRLVQGTHYVPNPNFVPRNTDDTSGDEFNDSHVTASVGDIVKLTDAQFSAFKDRFIPVTDEATAAKDADAQTLLTAQRVAAATGKTIDPNKPIGPQISGVALPGAKVHGSEPVEAESDAPPRAATATPTTSPVVSTVPLAPLAPAAPVKK